MELTPRQLVNRLIADVKEWAPYTWEDQHRLSLWVADLRQIRDLLPEEATSGLKGH